MNFPPPRRCDDCGQTKVCARVNLLGVPLFLCDACAKELGPMDVGTYQTKRSK